ncbi:hypothetical protein CGH26_22450, partial [Vibrio parahaemolyticus]
KLTRDQTHKINRMIVENSHNCVISHEERGGIELLLPRVVDREQVEAEREHWKNWHLAHQGAESVFYSDYYT